MPQNNTACPICQEPRKQCAQQNCYNEFNSRERLFCDRCHDYHFDSAPLQHCYYMEGGALVCNFPPMKNASTCERHKDSKQKVEAWIKHQKHFRQQLTCVFHPPQSRSRAPFITHESSDHTYAGSFGIEAPITGPQVAHTQIHPQGSSPPSGRQSSQTSRAPLKVVEL